MAEALKQQKSLCYAPVVDGAAPLLISELSKHKPTTIVFIARDKDQESFVINSAAYFLPDHEVIEYPSWDCLPYDRMSPHGDISSKRVTALTSLLTSGKENRLVVTNINALIQKTLPRDFLKQNALYAEINQTIKMDEIILWLESNGYIRTSTVREAGEYAVRGGIIDLFPAGQGDPWRLDFFGDTLEGVRIFDADTQTTSKNLRSIKLLPISEVILKSETVSLFRKHYVEAFGPPRGDPLFDAVGEMRRIQGIEHWLPLFYNNLDTIFDYLPQAHFVFDEAIRASAKEISAQINDYYNSRKKVYNDQPDKTNYKPVDVDKLFLTEDEFLSKLHEREYTSFSAFQIPDAFEFQSKQAKNFSDVRKIEPQNLFEKFKSYIFDHQSAGAKVIMCCWSQGSLERLVPILADHGLSNYLHIKNINDIKNLNPHTLGLSVLPLASGFEYNNIIYISEQDLLGERQIKAASKRRRAQDFLTEITSLNLGDYVVHIDHGIGQFINLVTVEAAGAQHDCLEIHYADGAKLFLPVENIDLLTRYGSDETNVQCDRLGGTAWQARKAKMKQRLLDMAGQLMKVAAARIIKETEPMQPPHGAYEEFCAAFPYEETEDQLTSIHAVLDDLSAGKPMDRLVCGDVGFGKTEVALRAAYTAAMCGKQVAVVVPTTLLARQHMKTFQKRFEALPLVLRQASRLVSNKELADTKKGLKEGTVDIVIGTHALLGKNISFKNLGLVIIDEEQHFGVAHKERLKELRANVHVLTLTATPIPRTLQLALSGVRELSLITTPPVDRLAVRNYITPFDPIIVREALLREKYRGGQAFYVVPRIADLSERAEFLATHIPEIKFEIAHGQMSPTELDDIMNNFYEGKFDVLLSTTIVESGLDIPTANTLIVHKADRFGLSQLYQLKGRVGRSKIRGYAYFTTDTDKKMTESAEKRLKVLSSLDSLGAGFQLASHDLDIRGAGNLLGEEQSGHIREVGYELYQQMLQEALIDLQAGHGEVVHDSGWSPQITLGMAVLIPEAYVSDLGLRMSLYRRLGQMEDQHEIDQFAIELVDRFGSLPEETEQLLKIVSLKLLCRAAGVEKVDAGPRGVVISFRNNTPPNLQGLIGYMTKEAGLAKLRPDQKIVIKREWPRTKDRLQGTTSILRELAALAEQTASVKTA